MHTRDDDPANPDTGGCYQVARERRVPGYERRRGKSCGRTTDGAGVGEAEGVEALAFASRSGSRTRHDRRTNGRDTVAYRTYIRTHVTHVRPSSRRRTSALPHARRTYIAPRDTQPSREIISASSTHTHRYPPGVPDIAERSRSKSCEVRI